ncbi:MAG: CRISPR-associated protein Cas6, partial [Deltaproteobacteria bacterium]
RYSNRQESKMFMGGIIGSITYEGELDEFYPLLKFCQEVHIGKATSFGLGKIKMD